MDRLRTIARQRKQPFELLLTRYVLERLQPPPRLKAYAKETVIAEKFQAMVALGRANSRMKDYYDIWLLARTYEFTDGRLPAAIAATFARRKTEIPASVPDGLSAAFASDKAKQRQWDAFAGNIEAEMPPLYVIIEELAAFLMPHVEAARSSVE